MPRKPRITAQATTLKNGAKRWRPKYGRDVVGVYVETEEQALADGAAWLAASKADSPKREQMTVQAFYELWTQEPGPYTTARDRAPSTNRHNRERVSLFAHDHGDLLLTEVDRMLARTWCSANPRRGGEVRTMFNDAFDDNLIGSNPFVKLNIKGMTKKSRKKISPLTETELHALAATADRVLKDRDYAPMIHNYILFAAYTGMRLGETSALTWTDVDTKAGKIHVARQWRSKENHIAELKSREADESRTIVLFPEAADALQAIRDTYGTDHSREHGEALIFTTPRGARLNARNHWHYWDPTRAAFLASLTATRFKQLQGVSGTPLHWHDLRHFTASWLINGGVSARHAAEQLGHDDGGELIQKLYGHTDKDEAMAEMQRWGAARRRKGGKAASRAQA